MRSRPEGITEEQVRAALEESWRLRPASLAYTPVGAGAYHWVATGPDGSRHFITVDDLDTKTWLGSEREEIHAWLERCYAAADILRRDAGLDFVVAPEPAAAGAMTARIGSRYSVAVLPFVDGRRLGEFDPPPEACADIVALMARLHEATPSVQDLAPVRRLEIPGRVALDAALAAVDSPWSSGPLAEDARGWLGAGAAEVMRGLRAYEVLADEVARSAERVVTHGEPHAGNFMLAGDRLLLVDWDTIALAPPARDLWLCCRPGSGLAAVYKQRTGRIVDPAAIHLFDLGWLLTDIAAYVAQLRSPHSDSEDARHALRVLRQMDVSALE